MKEIIIIKKIKHDLLLHYPKHKITLNINYYKHMFQRKWHYLNWKKWKKSQHVKPFRNSYECKYSRKAFARFHKLNHTTSLSIKFISKRCTLSRTTCWSDICSHLQLDYNIMMSRTPIYLQLQNIKKLDSCSAPNPSS